MLEWAKVAGLARDRVELVSLLQLPNGCLCSIASYIMISLFATLRRSKPSNLPRKEFV